MTDTNQDSPCAPETTELERRVLAHERVLQALIAYMSRTEPHFVEHLRARFIEPMRMARHEHDHRGVDDYAEEFIRAIVKIGEERAPKDPKKRADGIPGRPDSALQQPHRPRPQHDRVQLRERNGIWEVKVDGVFWGDYHQKDLAIAAMAIAKLSL